MSRTWRGFAARTRRHLAVNVGAISWLPRLLPAITATDLRLQRLTYGRLGLLDLAALPHLTLVVAGRRSGRLRGTPLLCVPRGGSWLVAGSNFGQPREPSWVANLAAAPRATVVWKGRRFPVTPVELTEADREQAWTALVATWPNFTLYEERTSRRIRVFELSPAASAATPALATPDGEAGPTRGGGATGSSS